MPAPNESTKELIVDRYELQETLGRGGMGVVWRAHDRLLMRDVAVKEVRFPATLPPDQRASAAERVMREARAAASLNHPAAVSVFDVVQDDGRAFIVMELLAVPTLASLIEADGALLPRRAAEIGLQILDALETAHGLGIVHRDVKPGNVMVLPDGRAKLADFGIATVTGDPRLTASGMILGSPQYMAPEQAQSAAISPATDIWALGATLYHAVEGKPPFDKGAAIPTLTAVLGDEPTFSGRSGELTLVIRACLAKEPELRPDPPRLRSMLQTVAEGTAPHLPETGPVRATATPAQAPAARSAAPRRTGRLVAAVIAGLVLIGAIAAALALSPNEDPAERAGGAGSGRQGAGSGEQGDGGNPEPAVPEGWTTYVDKTTGFQIAYPAGWQVDAGRGTIQSVDFVDPDSGAYMRVDWTNTPGPSPIGAWEAYEPDFEATHANYRRISMTEGTFKGFDASPWLYTWGDETTYQALNLGFVTGEYGFALNFQTPADLWDDYADELETFKATFVAP